MKLEMRFRPGDDVRAVWLAVLAVLLGGSCYVQTRYQSAIDASRDRTEMLYRQTVADTRIVREAASLRVIQKRAQADLARISRDASLSGTTANLLLTLHSSANTFHARILEIQPADSTPAVDAKDQTFVASALQATPLTIRVRGKFRDILGFVEDLSHHATLISVSDTEMAVANDAQNGASEPRLDATIHATMYRLTMPEHKEQRIASAG